MFPLYDWGGFCHNIYSTNSNAKHLHVDHVLLALSLLLWAGAYLNNVATEGPPQALLFRIVELIIGEVPGVLHFRLGHVLS